jgi:dCMP deaminase
LSTRHIRNGQISKSDEYYDMENFIDYQPPEPDIWFMKQVYLTAERSKDPSTKIGAVLVKDGNVIGSGYNGFARKVLDLPERYNNRELKYRMVVHGEANSVLTCARMGISTLGSILYSQGCPCENCMKSIIQAGVKEIVIHKQWKSSGRWDTTLSEMMIKETGIKLRYLDKVLNMKGYSDGKIVDV